MDTLSHRTRTVAVVGSMQLSLCSKCCPVCATAASHHYAAVFQEALVNPYVDHDTCPHNI